MLSLSGLCCHSLSSNSVTPIILQKLRTISNFWSGQSLSRVSLKRSVRIQAPGVQLRKLSETTCHPLIQGDSTQFSHVVLAGPGPELGGAVEVINNLGLDALTFLATTVVVIPAFKALELSPILGFLLSGVVLSQFGLIRNVTDVKALSELGILFLLFEMGLELSLARLKALAKFAFGIGLPQVILTTLAFSAFELPPGKAIGTRLLEFLFASRPDLVNIRSIDEAIVIGAALSLSSSAFVLQILSERGELATKFGSATLGILLLQDIAVVPLLVILPILETGNFTDENVLPLLLSEGLKALLGLGVLLLAGRLLLRRFFEVVADSRSSEAFVALCLLSVTGTSMLTKELGFSDSLGAFLAGALLAETNYRTQVEADIQPFRGLLLGLFFVTTGFSVDFDVLVKEWPNILALLGGLIAIKTAIITAIGPRAGLTLAESLRTGLLLSQGGEFAFVVFSLANQLGVLPTDLNRLLIIVVVLSMALTPLLDSVGRALAEKLEQQAKLSARGAAGSPDKYTLHTEEMMLSELPESTTFEATDPVVILGFGQVAQVLANFLSTPLSTGDSSGTGTGAGMGWPFVCFDLDPYVVKRARKEGYPVLYGDGSRAAVLHTAGIARPRAVVVMHVDRERAKTAVERIRLAFPGVPIYCRSRDLSQLLTLKLAGASNVVLESAEAGLRLGAVLLQDLGVMRDDVEFLSRVMREAMDQRAQEAYVNRDDSHHLGQLKDKVRSILKRRRMPSAPEFKSDSAQFLAGRDSGGEEEKSSALMVAPWDARLISRRNADVSRIRSIISLSSDGEQGDQEQSSAPAADESAGAPHSSAGLDANGSALSHEADGRGVSYCELYVDDYDGTTD